MSSTIHSMGRPQIPPVERNCELCGTPFLTPRHRGKRFCSRKCAGTVNSPFRNHTGPNNARYNGGFSTSQGRMIVVNRNGGFTAYSRVVMMAHLGRELRSDEIVHHINGDRTDDRLVNLQLVTRAEHAKIHRDEKTAGEKWPAMRTQSRLFLPTTLAAVVLVIDAISKAIVVVFYPTLAANDHRQIPILGMLTVLAVGLLVVRLTRDRLMAAAVGVCVGGGLGNLLERVTAGHVTDWIPLGGYVWDLADVALAVSVVLFGVALVRLGP